MKGKEKEYLKSEVHLFLLKKKKVSKLSGHIIVCRPISMHCKVTVNIFVLLNLVL